MLENCQVYAYVGHIAQKAFQLSLWTIWIPNATESDYWSQWNNIGQMGGHANEANNSRITPLHIAATKVNERRVCHKEICWKIPVQYISLSPGSLTYDVGM